MRFWSNDYDTWAADDLTDIKAEMLASNIISEDDWDSDDWQEVSGTGCMWIIPQEDINMTRYRNNTEYAKYMREKYFKTLDYVFDSADHGGFGSLTHKAWLMCSTEW